MRIFSVDPGGTETKTKPGGRTGWVLVDVDLVAVQAKLLDWGQLGPEDHHDALNTELQTAGPDLIICERFEHRNNEFANLGSLEYIGVVKRFAQRHNVTVVFQGASEAKGWATNAKLDALKLLLKPLVRWKHANDAMRHLVYQLCCTPAKGDKLVVQRALLEKLRPLTDEA